jgi:hypothetical protein
MLKKAIVNLSFVAICASSVAVANAAEVATNVAASNSVSTIFERARPDYDALGVKLGSFVLKPSIAAEERFSDNIYATETNEKDDFITSVKPAFELVSDWNVHELSFNASADVGRYANYSDENYEDYSVGTEGRIDILRETYATAGLQYYQRHEDRGSAEANTINAVEPTIFHDLEAKLNLYRGAGRFSVALDNQYDRLTYENGYTAAGAVLDNTVRDRDEYRSRLKIAYELIPNYSAFVSATYLDKEYDTTTAALNRNSNGYDLNVGTDINISGKTKAEVFVGYYDRNYEDVDFKDQKGLAFGADVIWDMSDLTSFDANVVRSIEETTIDGASGYVSTKYSVGAEHELRRNILLGLDASYATNEYNGAAVGDIEREDDISEAGAKVSYLLNRNVTLDTSYTYRNRNSNIADQDYDANIVMVGVKLAL